MSSSAPSSRKRKSGGTAPADTDAKRRKDVVKGFAAGGGKDEECGDDDWRKSMRNVRVAELCGMELMYADTPLQKWSFPKMMEKDLYELIPHMYFIHGKTRTGKSFWTRDFLYHFRNIFPYGWIFSHTKHNGFWQQVRSCFIYPGICEKFTRTLTLNTDTELGSQRMYKKNTYLRAPAVVPATLPTRAGRTDSGEGRSGRGGVPAPPEGVSVYDFCSILTWRRAQYFPNHLIIPRFDPAILYDILRIQKQRALMKGINPHIFLLFDDVASDLGIKHQEAFRELAMMGRHYKITTFFLTQHYTTASTQVRSNASWDILFTTSNEVALKHIEEELANDFASPQDFRACLDINTKDHQVVMVSQNPKFRGSERYWTYKAQEPPRPFVLLCDRAWGGNRFEKCAKQRKEWEMPPEYANSTLERMFRQETTAVRREHIAGNTKELKRAEDVRPWDCVR